MRRTTWICVGASDCTEDLKPMKGDREQVLDVCRNPPYLQITEWSDYSIAIAKFGGSDYNIVSNSWPPGLPGKTHPLGDYKGRGFEGNFVDWWANIMSAARFEGECKE